MAKKKAPKRNVKKKTLPPIDWTPIKLEYITSKKQISYAALAKKYKVAKSSVVRWGNREGWVAQRNEHLKRVAEKSKVKIENRQADEHVLFIQKMKKIRDVYVRQIGPIGTVVKDGREVGYQFNHEVGKQEALMKATVELSKYIDLLEGRSTERREVVMVDEAKLSAFMSWLLVTSPPKYAEFCELMGYSGSRRDEILSLAGGNRDDNDPG